MVKSISLIGLNKADVLKVLYNAAKPPEPDSEYYNSEPMTTEEAQKQIDLLGKQFVYMKHRYLRINLYGDNLDPAIYNACNGQGTAERAISELRDSTKSDS